MKLGVEKYNAVLRQVMAQRGAQNNQMHYVRTPRHLEGQIPPDFQPFPQHPEMLNQPGHQQQIGGGIMNDLNDIYMVVILNNNHNNKDIRYNNKDMV